MRVLTCCLTLVLLASSLRAEEEYYSGDPAVPHEGFRSELLTAVDKMLHDFDEFRGDRVHIEGALERGGNPNDYFWVEGFTFTPLMLAARMNDADLVRLLLGKGADPNREENRNLMSEVIASGSPEILHLLINKGWKFDPNTPVGSISNAIEFSLPLLSAIYHLKVEIVRALLDMGADPWLTEKKAKRSIPWNEEYALWKGTDNAFDVCENLINIIDNQDEMAKQAEIRKLLEQHKDGKRNR